MASPMSDGLVVDNAKFWKGSSRLVLGPVLPVGTDTRVFPTKIEDILVTAVGGTKWQLQTGWIDFAPLNEDGVTVTRGWDVAEGFRIDQKSAAYRAGGISNAVMSFTGTSMYTDLDTLIVLWNLGVAVPVSAGGSGATANVAQRYAPMGAPTTVIERYAAVLQMDEDTAKLRALVFRKSKFAVPGDMNVQASDPSASDFTIQCQPAGSISDGSDFGRVFESNAAIA